MFMSHVRNAIGKAHTVNCYVLRTWSRARNRSFVTERQRLPREQNWELKRKARVSYRRAGLGGLTADWRSSCLATTLKRLPRSSFSPYTLYCILPRYSQFSLLFLFFLHRPFSVPPCCRHVTWASSQRASIFYY